ncbi:hypothetical protein KEJ29_04110 [Candidatus Bathyarchaeota archaeon]|nr:hypothetical protein [Candidatus Bathyarchaeota archaeon]
MENAVNIAENLMCDFAHQTGLISDLKPRRYLWTDSFAVCNFIELYYRKADEKFIRMALKLIDQVHFTLGRHREDDPRSGWISGLSEEEGWKHPTIGGLRIGKPLPERGPNEPFDEVLEWERDGQYYHYLTKWMHALNIVGRSTGCLNYHLWAIELAKRAHKAFVYEMPNGRKRIYWKMSIDLSRPLVPSMGQHDPLDGLVTYMELQASALGNPSLPGLAEEIRDMESICDEMSWVTDDPLGIGELLVCSYRLARLIVGGHFNRPELLTNIMNDALLSLELYLANEPMRLPATMRLAFRELGLSIGLKAAVKLREILGDKCKLLKSAEIASITKDLLGYAWLSEKIDGFWLSPENRKSRTWLEHKDINMVMLATSLIPDAFLGDVGERRLKN